MLGGLEKLIGDLHKEELMPKVPHILKLCYDSDIIDEEVILDWASKVSHAFLLMTLHGYLILHGFM